MGWRTARRAPPRSRICAPSRGRRCRRGRGGLSTGLDYPPGAYASTEELIAITSASAEYGGFYHTHTRASLRSLGLLAPWEEALEIGRKSGAAVHLTHYRQTAQGVGSHHDYIGLVEDGRAEGLDVTFDCYTYPYSGTSATIILPEWAMSGGPERLMQALRDPADRAHIKREVEGPPFGPWESAWLTWFRKPGNAQYEGRSVAAIAEMRNQDPIDALLDLLLDEELSISYVGLGTNEATLYAFVSHPYGMIASDAILLGEFPSPRTYGCFPVVLAEFVRAEKHLRLPEAIRKMTSFPAQRLGLPDRGTAPRRVQGRHRRVRRQRGEGAGDESRAKAVPHRHRLRDRQRRDRDRPG